MGISHILSWQVSQRQHERSKELDGRAQTEGGVGSFRPLQINHFVHDKQQLEVLF